MEIDHLTHEEIRPALVKRFPEFEKDASWSAVRADLESGETSNVVRRLSTPWKLMLALTAIESRERGIEPDTLVEGGPEQDEQLHNRLLGEFIPATHDLHREDATSKDPAEITRWLVEIAGYLDRSGSRNIVLEKMWPIAGRRVRAIHVLVHTVPLGVFVAGCVLAVLGGVGHAPSTVRRLITGTYPYSSLSGRRFVVVAVFSAVLIAAGIVLAWQKWPWVPKVERRTFQLRNRRGFMRLVSATEIGGAIGIGVGLAVLLLFGPVAGIAAGAVFALLFGAGMEMKVGLDRKLSGNFAPGFYWFLDFIFAILFSGVCAAAFPSLLDYPWTAGAAFGAALGFSAGFGLGLIGWLRYVTAMSVMRIRRKLPWRLAAFLAWAYTAGILRIDGVAYQFRHDELFAWLVRHQPTPESERSAIA